MFKQMRRRWKQLLRYITPDPARFAAGSVASGPLGLLAVEQERVMARRSPRRPKASAAARAVRPGL